MRMTIMRVSLAAVLLLAAAASLKPYLTSYVSSSALVNAPLVTISAPFNGLVEQGSPRVAEPVGAGQTLFVLRNSRSQQAEVQSLRAEVGEISGEIAGLRMQMGDLDELSATLKERRDAKIAARQEWFGPRLDEARWEVARSDAEFERARGIHDRIRRLEERGNASRVEMIEAQADLDRARADLNQKKSALRRLEVEESTLDGARGIDLSSSDLEQIEYRIDEIAIRRADIDGRLLGLEARMAALQTQIRSVALESARQELFAPIAPNAGVVWNASPRSGAAVSGGDQVVEILDCSRRFLEVVLPERHFERVPAGTRAWVRLRGSTQAFSAEVLASYGSGARPNRATQAAGPRIDAPEGIRVIVGLGDVDMTSRAVARAFCDVGRAAEVRFDMQENVFAKAWANVAGWFEADMVAGEEAPPAGAGSREG